MYTQNNEYILVISLLLLPEILSGRSLSHTHLPAFVEQQPKKQFSRDVFENFMTAIVIKTLFGVSA